MSGGFSGAGLGPPSDGFALEFEAGLAQANFARTSEQVLIPKDFVPVKTFRFPPMASDCESSDVWMSTTSELFGSLI